MDKFKTYKKEIDTFIALFLSSKEKDLAKINPWGTDAPHKIQIIVSEGKTIRGSLVLLTHDIFGGQVKDDALRVAAAYELIQTGLIIHDDIMDHDALRRGKPTLHKQYDSEALAMCVGDILFFMAHELLASLISPKKVDTAIQTLSNQVFEEVGIAQMQDVSFGLRKDFPAKEEILSLYKYKTARYTFSLPMMAGAILAHADKTSIDVLEKLGEYMGILFQIQDDTIGLLGDPKTTGKSAGGDIREGKKTLAAYFLYHRTSPADKRLFMSAFGNPEASERDMSNVRKLTQKYRIAMLIRKEMHPILESSKRLIRSLTISDSSKTSLQILLEFVANRSF